jgi:hypothetical protein
VGALRRRSITVTGCNPNAFFERLPLAAWWVAFPSPTGSDDAPGRKVFQSVLIRENHIPSQEVQKNEVCSIITAHDPTMNDRKHSEGWERINRFAFFVLFVAK